MSEPIIRDEFSRSEAAGGIVWLCIGAAISVLMEVVYLNATIAGIAFPASIVVALFFNGVLTRTALLWTRTRSIALLPMAVWVAGFFTLMFVLPASGIEIVSNNILTVFLLFAGMAGGVWPVMRGQ